MSMNGSKLVTIIGRGHSATRAMSHTLTASGVHMGTPQNVSGDLLPPKAMYDACRVLAPYVGWKEGLEWDFSKLHDMEIPPEFNRLLDTFLLSVSGSTAAWRGWKIPETTLVYPWIVRRFPNLKYIFWIRNPCDCIIGGHMTDNLKDFGIPYPPTDDERRRRAISWKYQYDLVKATPKPKHYIEVRMEDFVLRQDETLARLGAFLGLKLAKIPVKPEAVDRWKTDDGVNYFDFFEPAMREYRYPVPAR